MTTQLDIFSPIPEPKKKTNYSWETSYPALLKNPDEKKFQKEQVYSEIRRQIKQGIDVTLLLLEELTGIKQGTVSARIGELKKEGRTYYDGTVFYKGMKRKKICLNDK